MQYETDKARTFQFSTEGSIPLINAGLTAELSEILREGMGITSLFPMQEAVFSYLQDASAKRIVGDVILCAPTGSGKTLAYALPIVQGIIGRKLPRLRAIIVLPTRDLATQVAGVFKELTGNFGISVALVSGATSIVVERASLKTAEILIATPGRLVDHIENGDALSLRSVRYLVLDESDRLLQDEYQGWIDYVLPLLGTDRSLDSKQAEQLCRTRSTAGIIALAIQPEVSARAFMRSGQTSQESVRKVLVSATQTKNPKRLVRLGLRHPKFFEPLSEREDTSLRNNYNIPSSLSEKAWIIRDAEDKPIVLLKTLGWIRPASPDMHNDPAAQAVLAVSGTKLIFTKSIQAAHRLCRLLEIFAVLLGVDGDVIEMSGDLSPARRKEVMKTVHERKLVHPNSTVSPHGSRFLVVVCSDVLARGVDIFNVDAVINYDVPVHIRTYVHRAGRTARAGRVGTVVTLLLSKQAHHFREMVRQADRGDRKVQAKNLGLRDEERDSFIEKLDNALRLLRRLISRETLGLLSADKPLPEYARFEVCNLFEEMKAGGWAQNKDATLPDDIRKRRITESLEPAKRGRLDLPPGDSPTAITTDGLDNIAATAEDETLGGEDEFQDVLFSQIARNLLSETTRSFRAV